MKIKVVLTIGYPTADREDILEIDDSELEGMTQDEKEKHLQECTEEWANEYIDYWYEEIKAEGCE
jgi:trans-2-enoyl-CoA reductase